MELPGINIKVDVNGEGVATGLAEVKGQLQGVGTEAEKAAGKVSSAGRSMEGSLKGVALGMSQTATSAFSLYQSFDNIEKKQYAVEKANLAADKATQETKKAQEALNTAVADYGPGSDQAVMAMERLRLAEETERLAKEKAEITQGNLNDSMMTAGLTIIPSVISGIDGMSRTWKQLQGLDVAKTLGGIKDGLSGSRMSLVSWGAGLAAVGVIFMAFNAKSQETRLMLSLLAGGLIAAASAQWILNAASAFGLSLTGVGIALVAVATAAAAAVYLLSSQYGAPAEPQTNVDANSAALQAGASGGSSSSSGELSDYDREMLARGLVKDQHGNWQEPGSFASGGWAMSPQLAYVAEREPELIIPQSRMGELGGGGTVIFNVNGARDVDLVVDEIVRKLRNEGGWR